MEEYVFSGYIKYPLGWGFNQSLPPTHKALSLILGTHKKGPSISISD